jgi:uncharacterized membrane protein YdjX (TVP38/TMEM64 family)
VGPTIAVNPAGDRPSDANVSILEPRRRRLARALWRWRGVALVGLWVLVVGSWIAGRRGSGAAFDESAQRLVDVARGSWWAVPAYLGLSVVRPLVLFPAVILTVVAGLLFGPLVGVVVAVVGSNASALLVHTIGGRAAPRDTLASDDVASTARSWAVRLRANAFESVLVMRLLFLPYDAVNLVCGVLRVPRRPFIAATAIGSVPGTVAFVLIGASIDRVDEGIDGLRPEAIVASVVLIVASIGVSRVLRRRSDRQNV